MSLPPPYPNHWPWRLLECLVHVLQGAGGAVLLMGLNRLFKPGTRALTDSEIALARPVFGTSLAYERVRIDARARVMCRRRGMAYVAFNVINAWGALSPAHFIHELTHIWQYQHVGAVYIPRALHAQRTEMGYNYGGPAVLQKAAAAGKSLLDFNYEQQADVVADYFCLKNDLRPRWCPPDPHYLPVFEKLIRRAGIDLQPFAS
jgi:hypothetical protein